MARVQNKQASHLAAVKQALGAYWAVTLNDLLAAHVRAEERQRHARIARHAVEEVHAQSLATPAQRQVAQVWERQERVEE